MVGCYMILHTSSILASVDNNLQTSAVLPRCCFQGPFRNTKQRNKPYVTHYRYHTLHNYKTLNNVGNWHNMQSKNNCIYDQIYILSTMGTLILPTGNNKIVDSFGLFTNYTNIDTVIFIQLAKNSAGLVKLLRAYPAI